MWVFARANRTYCWCCGRAGYVRAVFVPALFVIAFFIFVVVVWVVFVVFVGVFVVLVIVYVLIIFGGRSCRWRSSYDVWNSACFRSVSQSANAQEMERTNKAYRTIRK